MTALEKIHFDCITEHSYRMNEQRDRAIEYLIQINKLTVDEFMTFCKKLYGTEEK